MSLSSSFNKPLSSACHLHVPVVSFLLWIFWCICCQIDEVVFWICSCWRLCMWFLKLCCVILSGPLWEKWEVQKSVYTHSWFLRVTSAVFLSMFLLVISTGPEHVWVFSLFHCSDLFSPLGTKDRHTHTLVNHFGPGRANSEVGKHLSRCCLLVVTSHCCGPDAVMDVLITPLFVSHCATHSTVNCPASLLSMTTEETATGSPTKTFYWRKWNPDRWRSRSQHHKHNHTWQHKFCIFLLISLVLQDPAPKSFGNFICKLKI